MKSMKKIALLVALTFLVSSLAFAAPLDNYKKAGNAALGIFYKYDKISSDAIGGGTGKSSESALAFNLAATIAKNLALEFNYGGNPKVAMVAAGGGAGSAYGNLKYLDYDIKIKYMATKANKMAVTPYVGFAYDKIKDKYPSAPQFDEKDSRGQAIIGVAGVFTLANKFKAYADVGLGTKLFAWKVGLSYEVAKKLDIDLGYSWRRCEFKEYAGVNEPKLTKKGLLFGITIKFQ